MSGAFIQAYVEIGAKIDGLQKGVMTAKQLMKEYAKGAEDMTRKGADFRRIGTGLDDMIGKLRAATPANARLAAEAGKVWKSFEDGSISARQAADSLEQLKRSSMSAGERMKSSMSSAAGVITKVGIAAWAAGLIFSQAMNLGKAGAGIEYAEKRFDRLAEAIGTTSDALMVELKAATRGTMSDMELIASAGDLMALGLVKSHDQVVRLATVVGGLNMNMNQLVLTLANRTTMRFDQLGVSVAGFEDKVKSLQAAGMSLEDAFTEAFIQQSEMQLGKVGNAADTNVGKFKRFDAAVQNLGNSIKEKLAPTLAEAAEYLTDVITNEQALKDSLKKSEQEARKTTWSYRGYKEALEDIAEAEGLVINKEGDLVRRRRTSYGVTEDLIVANYQLSASLHAVMVGIENIPEDSFIEKYRRMMNAVKEEGDKAAKEAEDALNLALQGPVREENKDYKGKMADNAESIKEVKDQLRELGADPGITDEQLGQIGKFQSKLTGAWVELKTLEDLAGQGEYAFRPMAGALDALREKGIDEATIERVGELHTTIMAAEIGIRKMGGLPYVTAEQREQIDALKEQLGELEGAQVQIGVEHRNNAKQMVFDMMQQQMAADGMSEAESDALMSLAGNLGLADEQTMALYESSKDFTDQLMSAQTKADDLGVSIEELPEYKKIVIDIKTIGATNIFSMLDNIGGNASGGGGGGSGSGFATGGSFTVGGGGGTDSQPVAFWATPGERVTVETPAQQARGGGGETVIYNRFYGPVSLQSLASVPKTRKTSMLGQMR